MDGKHAYEWLSVIGDTFHIESGLNLFLVLILSAIMQFLKTFM